MPERETTGRHERMRSERASADARPDPDALLKRVKHEEAREKRAKLKIFFGFAPGVGKTYAMLAAARRLKADGVDVVVGAVETHGRSETAALTEGLPTIERARLFYRGKKLEEFDLDQALARRPQVLLLDELAHTNVPGSRHEKRWQDVTELLEAGIEVHTTLNVQHVESLNDIVMSITGVRVRETVPDATLDRADEIALVDLPPDDLLLRLQAGKVYVPEQAERAGAGFFKLGNLLALRELAMRCAADRVDADVRAYREEHDIKAAWSTAERILVAIGPGASAARVVRAARRMAQRLGCPWVVANVASTAAQPLSAAAEELLEATMRMAETLGADTVRLTGLRRAETLLDYARAHHVTRIVLGRPRRGRFLVTNLWRRLKPSLADDLVAEAREIDVHVVADQAGEVAQAAAKGERDERLKAPHPAIRWSGYGWSALLVMLATLISALGRGALVTPDVSMLYLAVIMVSAVVWGRGPSVLAAALAVASYDFMFIPPFYTFAVTDVRHVLTFATMFAVGLLISGLATRIRRQELEARRRESRTASLYSLSRDLGTAATVHEVCVVALRHVADVFQVAVRVVGRDGEGNLQVLDGGAELMLEPQSEAAVRWSFEHSQPAGTGTTTLPNAPGLAVPLVARSVSVGVLYLARAAARTPGPRHWDDPAERHLLDLFARQIALALERVELVQLAEQNSLRARTEEMRSSILAAVSHDLRTPLATITGAATMLRDASEILPLGERQSLLGEVCDEAERLERLVGNLLEMTRLESGHLHVAREWVPLEEVVGAALSRAERTLRAHPLTVDMAPGLGLASIDPVLVEQVLLNVLDNAVKYAPPGTPIEVAVWMGKDAAMRPEHVVAVRDRGPGFPPGTDERIFEKFFRGVQGTQGVAGAGLGLAITRGIVEAHGGRAEARARDGGGAEIRLHFPIVGIPPTGQLPQLSAFSTPSSAPSEARADAPLESRESSS